MLHRLCALVASASAALRAALVRCFQSFPRERFVRLLEVTQQLVSVHLLETGKVDDVVEAGTAVLVRRTNHSSNHTQSITGKHPIVSNQSRAITACPQACLHAANEALKRPLVPYAAFYLEAANEESFDLREARSLACIHGHRAYMPACMHHCSHACMQHESLHHTV